MRGPSPLQNRVLPTGEIVAVPARGLMLGNRGCIHRPDRTLGAARWRSPAWICCVLSWRGVRRDVMPPGRWTALFFLDEVTALSAGHRPCAYCRREDYLAFADAWARGHGHGERPKAPEIDAALHETRLVRGTRDQRVHGAPLGSLPDGSVVRHGATVALVVDGALRPWSFEGYGRPEAVAPQTGVEVLTPPGTVRALAAGYRPLVHPSVLSPSLRTISTVASTGASQR